MSQRGGERVARADGVGDFGVETFVLDHVRGRDEEAAARAARDAHEVEAVNLKQTVRPGILTPAPEFEQFDDARQFVAVELGGARQL